MPAAAVAVYRGPYNRLNEAHKAIGVDGGEQEGVCRALMGDLRRSGA
jgi:hypothetical protein